MKPPERKQNFVQKLSNLYEKISVERLYNFPRQKDVQDWLAKVAAIFKNLDECDYQEIIRLSKTITPTETRINRIKAAYEIYNFVRRKVAEYKICDFSDLEGKEDLHKKEKINDYWNFVNPFWLIWKLLVFVWHHKIISALLIIIGLLSIDYSLAWKNTLWIVNVILGLFG